MSHADEGARFEAVVHRAARVARASGQSVLASLTLPAKDDEPLSALAKAMHAAGSDHELAALLGAGRMFWGHPRAGLSMAAMGAAVTLTPSGAGRFHQADMAWRALLDSAVSGGASECSAAGPLLLGGFSFEPDGPTTTTWQGFPATHLVVPALLLTHQSARTWLTTSVLVDAQGGTSVPLDLIGRLRSAMQGDLPPHEPRLHATERAKLAFRDALPAGEWVALVDAAVAAIGTGAFDKVVLAREVQAAGQGDVDIVALVDHLRHAHRDSYVFAHWRGDRAFVGATPERLVRLSGRVVEASSLAGSAPRGSSPPDDAALSGDLLQSGKDRAEHAMVRGALVRVLESLCDDVSAPAEPSLLTLPHVHHLHTAVRARLREGHSLLELAGALHPTPAVGGTPREPALAFIRAHERLDRGWYASPIGWVGRDAGEFAVALRSAVVDGAHATLFAGCGIVSASEAAHELAESRTKLRPMEAALEAAAVRDVASLPAEALR